ncbi:MAG TPA: hypothetical protein VFU19_17560 [Iamia sp.]|nr:hypothetical protein [Iamia sp.]
MAFGQAAGPPATHRQVQELLALVEAAGHQGFRDARHPLGLTQRQAAGKFTRDEADALIERLSGAGEDGSAGDGGADARPVVAPVTAADRKRASLADQLRRVPDDLLAAELQRRGYAVIQP